VVAGIKAAGLLLARLTNWHRPGCVRRFSILISTCSPSTRELLRQQPTDIAAFMKSIESLDRVQVWRPDATNR